MQTLPLLQSNTSLVEYKGNWTETFSIILKIKKKVVCLLNTNNLKMFVLYRNL